MPLNYIVKLVRLPVAFCSSGPMDSVVHYDVVDPRLKTARSMETFEDTETGLDRVKKMFQLE
jgi:hypothetical protein